MATAETRQEAAFLRGWAGISSVPTLRPSRSDSPSQSEKAAPQVSTWQTKGIRVYVSAAEARGRDGGSRCS